MKFKDRADAGKQLAQNLEQYLENKNIIVLGLPRGGVIPAFEVASALGLGLDIIVTRKIGAPMQPELAVGALTQDGQPMLNQDLIAKLSITRQDLEPIIAVEQQELQRRLKRYRGARPPLDLHGKIALLVDDGIATGATMLAAIKSARKLGAERIIVAVPVSPSDSLAKIKNEADEVVSLITPESFIGVGGFYQKFAQIEDEKVIDLLNLM